ncbi:MAG: radical SAM protein [Candidatus Thermoplasmatota archaeon]|nr:radical SAM protein [Candidatus Thermoplasmatota archaeon]
MSPYDFPPYRPPNEASSALIRASRGCPWNRCLFCTMYKGLKFEQRPLQDVKKDIDVAVDMYPGARAVFIADSDSLLMKDGEEIIRHIKKRFPRAERITSYARAATLQRLGVPRLVQLRKAGLTRVHVGLESGDADTLSFLRKGATPEQMIAGGKAAKDAGLEVSLYVLIGAGGKDRLTEHAVQSALVCNKIQPDFIRLRTLIVQHGSLLEEKMRSGLYRPTSPLEKLGEVKLFLEHLDVVGCFLASDHHTNYIRVGNTVVYRGIQGMLPEEKNHMIAILNSALEVLSQTQGEILDATLLYDRGLISSL